MTVVRGGGNLSSGHNTLINIEYLGRQCRSRSSTMQSLYSLCLSSGEPWHCLPCLIRTACWLHPVARFQFILIYSLSFLYLPVILYDFLSHTHTASKYQSSFGLIPIGGRSTAVKLATGKIVLFASHPNDEATSKTLKEMGETVSHVVALDAVHHLYIGVGVDFLFSTQVQSTLPNLSSVITCLLSPGLPQSIPKCKACRTERTS